MKQKAHTISELNELEAEGEGLDQELFAEQRSNIQLILGQHYAKRGGKFWNRLRDSKDISQEQKIRLTKNHIRRIVHTYMNSILHYSPGVQASPKDKSDLHNQKAAELVNAVWADYKADGDYKKELYQWCSDFCGAGEVAVKIFFNPMAGKFLGYEQEVDEFGQPVVDEMGQPVSSGNPKFQGKVEIERLFTWNLARAAGATSEKNNPWWRYKKMVSIKDVQAMIDASDKIPDEQKEELKRKIVETSDDTYIVLEGDTGKYKSAKNQTMLKEWYFKPCAQYPMGYYFICCGEAIIFEGELPYGIFPIVFEGFDEQPTSPRGRSIVKQLRPNQIEINRCASTMAETQITLGFDKVLVQNGTKLNPGNTFPGVRSYTYSGLTPIVMEGRTGAQYLEYMNANITELYQIANLDEQMLEDDGKQALDVFSMLNRSIKDKKKFSLYSDKFEGFLRNVFKTYIKLRQKYATPEDIIPAIGKSEIINIEEFKGVEDICYSIVAESQSDDSETKLGRQMMLQHIIQYVGPQLAQKDLGKLIRLMPYANDEQILEDLTLEYDFVTNMILALDRGQPVQVANYVKPEYVINRLTLRTVKADYQHLPQEVKDLYMQTIEIYEQLKVEEAEKIKQAQSEFIPTGGYLVAADFYVPDKNDPTKLPKRVRIPSESLDWLLKQIEAQGSGQEALANLSMGAQAEIADKFSNQGQDQRQMGMSEDSGKTNPQGAING